MAVKTAIIAAAGFGTRMLPATKAQPKEMITIVDKPAIQYVVEEAVAAGIKNIIFVTSFGKEAIENHFDRNFELEVKLKQKGKKEELKQITRLNEIANISYVRQKEQLGDGHAILTAVPFIERHEPVATMFADDVLDAKTPGLKQVIETYNKYEDPVFMAARVPKRDVSKYGVVDGIELDKQTWQVEKFVEKPAVADAPSNLVHIGRGVLSPDFVKTLSSTKPGKDGEIRLANAYADWIKAKRALYARVLDGEWLGCGNKLQLIRSSIHYGMKHPEIKSELKKYLKKVC